MIEFLPLTSCVTGQTGIDHTDKQERQLVAINVQLLLLFDRELFCATLINHENICHNIFSVCGIFSIIVFRFSAFSYQSRSDTNICLTPSQNGGGNSMSLSASALMFCYACFSLSLFVYLIFTLVGINICLKFLLCVSAYIMEIFPNDSKLNCYSFVDINLIQPQ